MTDINLVWDPTTATFDWDCNPGDLATGNDLETAVALSLFTDARAPADASLPDGTTDFRGCWIDTYSPTSWGSLLWMLNRAAIANPTESLRFAERAARAALKWMMDDGVASNVAAAATWLGQGALQLAVTITQPTSGPQTFTWAWNTVQL